MSLPSYSPRTHECVFTCYLIFFSECDDPRTTTACDPDRGVRIHQVTKFKLDEETLQCVPNTTVEEESFRERLH